MPKELQSKATKLIGYEIQWENLETGTKLRARAEFAPRIDHSIVVAEINMDLKEIKTKDCQKTKACIITDAFVYTPMQRDRVRRPALSSLDIYSSFKNLISILIDAAEGLGYELILLRKNKALNEIISVIEGSRDLKLIAKFLPKTMFNIPAIKIKSRNGREDIIPSYSIDLECLDSIISEA